jgi:UDP-glucose 4-epimerase
VIVLITGGAGFVGLNLMRQLLRVSDCQIRILDNFSNSTPERIDQVLAAGPKEGARVRVLRGDICDATAVTAAVDGVDAVIHLAAQTGIAPSLVDPGRDLQLNVVGTFNVLEACRACGVRRFVLASSAAVLGNAEPPQHEELPSRPLSPYGAGKAAAEAYCKAYSQSFGIETLALRFSNVYGPLSWNKGSVVAQFAKRAVAGQPLIVNGDGTQTRDFLFVEDLADVLVRAATSAIDPALRGQPCNVATGLQTQIADLADAFKDAFAERGRTCQIEFGPPLKGEVAVSAPATERLRRLFPGATLRSLSGGLAATIDWFLACWPGASISPRLVERSW